MSEYRAVVVEDDPGQSLIFSRALQQAGYTVLVIHDGLEALKHLEEHPPDLIVLDLHLPRVNGVKIAQAVHERNPGVKLILATADARLAETLHDVSDLILLKPVSFTQLRDLAMRIKEL